MKWLQTLLRELRKANLSNEEKLAYKELSEFLDESYWEIEPPSSFYELIAALQCWLPETSILYFDGGYPSKEFDNFFIKYPVPETEKRRTADHNHRQPKPYHAPATEAVLSELAKIMERHPGAELASDFLVYEGEHILLKSHDADDPILISSIIPEDRVKVFADRLGTKYERIA